MRQWRIALLLCAALIPPAAHSAPLPPAAPIPVTTTDPKLKTYDEQVKVCDHLLWQAECLTSSLEADRTLAEVALGDAAFMREKERRLKANAAAFGLEYSHAQYDALEQKAKSDEAEAAQDLARMRATFAKIAGFLRQTTPLSRTLHADPLFKANYFIGDRVIRSMWEQSPLWAASGLSGITSATSDDAVRYIESSKPGLGRPASELSVYAPPPGSAPPAAHPLTPTNGMNDGRKRFPFPGVTP